MSFPHNLLADDEQVVRRLHPHWKTLISPVFWLIVFGGGAGAGIYFLDFKIARLAIAGVAFLLICYFTIYPILRWISTRFVLTTHRVIIRVGILNRSGRDVPLARINDVSFERTLLERILGCGTLVVESAGEHGQIVLSDISKVEEVQSLLYRLVEQDAERRRGDSAPGYPARAVQQSDAGW